MALLASLDFHATTVGDTLRDAEGGAVAARLVARGMRAADADAKAALFAAAAKRLEAEGVAEATPAAAFWVPGRVEVLGKHTDYAGGRSLLGAARRAPRRLRAPGRGPLGTSRPGPATGWRPRAGPWGWGSADRPSRDRAPR